MKILSSSVFNKVLLFHIFWANNTVVGSKQHWGQEQRDLITNGETVPDSKYPFFAFMKLGPPTGCGGTLIHEDIVLTSAQCREVFEGRGVHIGGDHTQYGANTASEFHEDESVLVHPDYIGNNNYYKNDIMLVKLQTSSNLPPVTLGTEDSYDETTPLTVIGHGDTSFVNGQLSDVLKEAKGLLVKNFGICHEIYEAQAEENDVLDEALQMCADDPSDTGKDTCQADAGGPLLVHLLGGGYIQIGITSFGIRCGENPSVYTRLSHYKDWIDENICMMSSNPPSTCNNYTGGGSKETLPPTIDGGVRGDPHFKTWDGQLYDFHGVCDLVLLHTPEFMNGLGIDIHIRSTRTRQWSYISRAVVKIGSEIFELATSKDRTKFSVEYFVNGISGKDDHLEKHGDIMKLPNTISGFEIQYRAVNSQQLEYLIDLGNGEKISMHTWKHMIRIDLQGCKAANFASSVGLMGTFTNSHMVGRDNSTIIENLNEFGQEWQVLPEEGNLFQTLEGPQAPSKCELPSKSQLRRRLAQSDVTIEEAKLACAKIFNEDDFNLCVFDIIATGDIASVGIY